MRTANFPYRKKIKRTEAVARQAEHDKLSPAQLLEKLDQMFGVGQGAARQRARLKKAPVPPVVVEKAPEETPASTKRPVKRARKKS